VAGLPGSPMYLMSSTKEQETKDTKLRERRVRDKQNRNYSK